MIKKSIFDLKGDEILAKPIMNSSYQIILPENTVLSKGYINTIMELGILEVFVRGDKEIETIELLKTEVKIGVTAKVKDILERYVYQESNNELMVLAETADRIIENIMSDERVVEKVYDIRERSTDLYEHAINVCSTAILTGLKMELSDEIIHDIGVGCLLHDIGLREVTMDYANMDVSQLSEEQLTEYKKHPIYGFSSIQNEDWVSDITKEIVLSHHERLDGSGFPLHKKEISIPCGIVSVCDVFDEMICGISTPQVKVHEAIEYLKYFQKTQFDDKIVEVFLSFTAVYPSGSYVKTNKGEIAIVLSQNLGFQSRPMLKMVKDQNGNDYSEEVIVNLIKERTVFIEDVINPKNIEK